MYLIVFAFRLMVTDYGFILCLGLTLEKFTALMSLKLGALDEDECIRQTFLAFDFQCMNSVCVYIYIYIYIYICVYIYIPIPYTI